MMGNQLAVFKGHSKDILSVCVTIDGKIISGSGDGTARVLDMTGKELTSRTHAGPVAALAVTKDVEILSGFIDGVVQQWDITAKNLRYAELA